MKPSCAAVLAFLLGACGTAAGASEAPFAAQFAVRGRWPGERVISYRVSPEGGPLPAATLCDAVEAALARWSASGCVRFVAARSGDEAELVFAWRTGAHDACPAFGVDPSVAHAGPVGPGTFVHFDAEREWSADGAHGLSLRQAALHELGHVLGLDHSSDERAVMYPEPSAERDRLGASDLAGLHALYGGGASGDGDLTLTDTQGRALVLPRVAPPELSAWAAFDTDGDGDDELLVWRTDRAGAGALTAYHFARGPLLDHTVGPLYGAVVPGLAVRFARGAHGERLLLQDGEAEARGALEFDALGLLHAASAEAVLAPRFELAPPADLDGDGRPEVLTRR